MKLLHIKYLDVITIGFKTLLKMVKTDLQYCKLSKYKGRSNFTRTFFNRLLSEDTSKAKSHISSTSIHLFGSKKFIQNIVYVKDFC